MSIINTKVSLPERRKDILRRVRLVDALHQNLHRKLTFISAPAGYGKTTLLVDFASDVDAVVCWYRIGPDDTDLNSFTQHLVAAFRQKYPQFGDDLNEIFQTGGRLDPQNVAAEIINEIDAHIDDYSILMLDDYHLVGETQPIIALIEALLSHLPDQVRLVIASRSIYGVPSATLYVRDELTTLGANDLRFRADELQALVRQSHHFKLSDEQASELAARSDGWIVAIMLAIRTMQHGALPKFDQAVDQVYDFLAEEVVNQQQPQLQDFLLATAIFEEFDEALCNHLLQITSAGDLLNELIERNLFITRIGTKQSANYRYHQLFSDFLRNRLLKTDLKKMRTLNERAAHWYWQQDAWEPAVRHILSADQPEKAARWMDLAATEFYVRGRQTVLSKWYETLSKLNLIDQAPRLLLYQAKVLGNQSSIKEAEALLDLAEPRFQHDGDIDQVVNVMITRGMGRRFQGAFSDALIMGNTAQKILIAEGRRDSYWWYQADRLKGKSLSNLDRSDESIDYLQRAITGFRISHEAAKEDYQRVQREHDLAETLIDLGVIYIKNGAMLEAQSCFLEALEIRRKRRGNKSALAVPLNNVGYVYYQIGNYREAWRAYEEALENARLTGWKRTLVDIHNSRGDLLRDIEEWDAAEAAYSTARDIGEANNEQLSLIDTYAGLSELELIRGNHQQAFHWLREATRYRKDTKDSPTYQAKLGTIYLEMEQLDLACQALENALEAWENLSQPQQDQVLAAFHLGNAYFKRDQTDRALASITTAFKWSAQLGYDQFLVVAGRRCQAFITYAMQAWPDHPQLKSLIQRIEQLPTGLASLRGKVTPIEIPPKHFEIHAYGSGQVRCNGELIPRANWRSSGARALFFYIIHHQEVRKEDVGLEFWPEFSPAKISSNFHATLWRVRQALGEGEIISFRNQKYSLNPAVTIWYDVDEFLMHLDQAEEEKLSTTKRAEHWRQAIALYQGDYLEDIYMDWSARRSAELKEMYKHALANLAQWETKRQHFEVAIALYERVLQEDPYRDDIHLALMKCLANSGSPTRSKAHFQTYRDFLHRELDTEPSPELQDFYNQLAQLG
jgi:LuxR family transcriptional regulator, maltose regulon positive regulatory protein